MTDEELFDAARAGDRRTLARVIEGDPERINIREKPYGWTLLHAAAHKAQLDVVDYLLARGFDANAKEQGDNTTAMHWAAAAGSASVVRRLAEAGGDVVGHGDEHALGVIGWATCWDGCDDDAHRAVVDVLLEYGAAHTIYSAIAMNRADLVREMVARDSSALIQPRSRHEHFEMPLQFAVQRNQPEMVRLLLELGADPLAKDAAGIDATGYAAWKRVDVEIVRMLVNADAGNLLTSLALGNLSAANRIVLEDPAAVDRDGVLHLLSKRGSAVAITWLIDHGADVNALWNHWGAMVTPLHMAVLDDNLDAAHVLLARGADATIRDSMHDSDALGWAEFMGRGRIAELIRGHRA